MPVDQDVTLAVTGEGLRLQAGGGAWQLGPSPRATQRGIEILRVQPDRGAPPRLGAGGPRRVVPA